MSFSNTQEKSTVVNAFHKYHVNEIYENSMKINQFSLNENEIKDFVTEVLLFDILNLIELEGLK